MTAVVVDASVAVKWVVQEEDSDAAVALSRYQLWAPDLLRVEAAHALWGKARRGQLNHAEVVERVEALSDAALTLVPQEELLDDAVRLALEIDYNVYACLYLALAVQHGTYVVSGDRRFVGVVRRSATYRDRIRSLSESDS